MTDKYIYKQFRRGKLKKIEAMILMNSKKINNIVGILLGISIYKVKYPPNVPEDSYFTNVDAVLEAFYNLYKTHPEENIDQVLYNALHKLTKSGLHVYEFYTYLHKLLQNEVNGTATFKIDLLQLLKDSQETFFIVESRLEKDKEYRKQNGLRYEIAQYNVDFIRYVGYDVLKGREDAEAYKEDAKVYAVYRSFRKKYPRPSNTAEVFLKTRTPKEYAIYLEHSKLSAKLSDHVEKPTCLLAMAIASLGGIGILLDTYVKFPILHVVWGVALSVAMHWKFVWDFSIFKSIVGTTALCLVPLLLCAGGMGGFEILIKAATMGIPLIMLLVEIYRFFKVRRSKKEAAIADTVRSKLENTQQLLQNKIFEEYKKQVGDDIAREWAKQFSCL